MEGGVYKAEFVYIRDSEETPPADSPRETTHALKVSFHWKKKRLFDKIEKLQGAMVTSGVMGGWGGGLFDTQPLPLKSSNVTSHCTVKARGVGLGR